MVKPIKLSVLEKRIGKFIQDYGVNELIKYLEEYDHEYSARDYRLFQDLKTIFCEAYCIPLDELRIQFINADNTDARISIAYCAYVNTKLNQEAIHKLMDVSVRSIQRYIDKAQYRLDRIANFRGFVEKYQDGTEKFLIIKQENRYGRKSEPSGKD